MNNYEYCVNIKEDEFVTRVQRNVITEYDLGYTILKLKEHTIGEHRQDIYIIKKIKSDVYTGNYYDGLESLIIKAYEKKWSES